MVNIRKTSGVWEVARIIRAQIMDGKSQGEYYRALRPYGSVGLGPSKAYIHA